MGSIKFTIEMGFNFVIFILCTGSLIFAAQYYHNINKKKREAEKEKPCEPEAATKKEE